MSDLKTPLAAAARIFSEVCEVTDNAPVIDDKLKELFADAHEELQYRVDKRIFFDREMKLRKEAVAAAIKHYKDQAMYLDEVHDHFKELVQKEVESAPGIEFRGPLGKIWVQDNTPGVDYVFGENRPQKLETLQFYGVPHDFIEILPTYRVKSEITLDALKGGETLAWAKLKPPRGVRFSPMRKPKELKE